MPAIEADGQIRDGAWVAEATDMTDPTKAGWPQGSRLILRKERPHPGAQLTFTDADGMRVTAFLTDTPPGALPGQIAGLELRHRQHARVEDRIREAKTTGLRNLPCRGFTENAAWLETVLCAVDLVCWTKLIWLPRRPRTRQVRDLDVPLPGPPRGRPPHPRRPLPAATHRQHLALGHPDRRRLPPTPRSLQLTTQANRPRPTNPRNPPLARDSHSPDLPARQHPQPATDTTVRPPPQPRREKSRLSAAWNHRHRRSQDPVAFVAAHVKHRSLAGEDMHAEVALLTDHLAGSNRSRALE